jgi:hypothetical protein
VSARPARLSSAYKGQIVRRVGDEVVARASSVLRLGFVPVVT